MKFSVIISDPPWSTNDKLTMSDVKRGADANYDTMSLSDICALDVKSLADEKGCILALWVLGSMLEEGLQVMKSWGFKQKQILVWVKTKKSKKKTKKNPNPSEYTTGNCLSFGMGRLWRQSHEVCLIGINNTGIYKKLKNKSQRSVIFDENNGHSIKPNALHDSLDIMFSDVNKLEMFARRDRPNWTCVGIEAPASLGEDMKDSILRLKNAPSTTHTIT